MTSAYSFLVLNCISIYFIAIQLAISTLQLKPNCVPKFIKLTSNLVKPLCTGIGRNNKAECMANNVPSPYFQLRMLHWLCSLCNNNQIWKFGTLQCRISQCPLKSTFFAVSRSNLGGSVVYELCFALVLDLSHSFSKMTCLVLYRG